MPAWNGQTDGRTDGRTDGCTDGRTDGQTDGRMNERSGSRLFLSPEPLIISRLGLGHEKVALATHD